MNLKCIYTNLTILYAKRVLYGIECNMVELVNDILESYRYSIIEENLHECTISGNIVYELNKFKDNLKNKYVGICPC